MENITSSNSTPNSVPHDARSQARWCAGAGLAVLPIGSDGLPGPVEGTLAATRSPERIDQLWHEFPDGRVGVVVGEGISAARISSSAEQRFASLADSVPATFYEGDDRVVLFGDDVLAVASEETITTGVTLLGPGELLTLPTPSTWPIASASGATLLAPPPKWLVDTYGAWEQAHLDQQAQRLAAVVGAGSNDFVELIALGKPTMGTYAKGEQLASVAGNGCACCYGNGIYFLGQGLDPALLHRVNAVGAWAPMSRRATDVDVLATRYFYIDADPLRPPDTSATSEERAAALEIADVAEQLLCRAAGDCFARLSSGNGFGFILPVTPFAPTREMAAAWKGVLSQLNSVLGTKMGKFDTTVFNPSRLIPMPGTVKRKGRSAFPRLHRRVHLEAHRVVRSDPTDLIRRIRVGIDQHATRRLVAVGEQLQAAEPSAVRGTAPPGSVLGTPPLDIRDLAEELGLAATGDRVTCPGCGETDALIGDLGIKCFHARCAESGSGKNGFYTAADMIEASQGVSKGEARAKVAQLTGGPPSNTANIANEPWPELQPLHDESHGPAFPLQALPGLLELWAASTAASYQVPVDLPAVLALSAVASAAQARYRVQVKPDWEMPVCLFTAIAMASGTRKSPVFRSAMQPILAREKLLSSHLAPRRRTAQMTVAALEKSLEKAVDASLVDPKKKAEVAKLEAQLAQQHVPVIPTLVIADATPEAITAQLAEQGGCLTVASPEAEIFEIVTGRYSETPALEVLLKAYSGDDIKVARVRRQVVRIEDPAMTIALAVQPGALYEAVSNQRLRSRGLIARFLMSVPSDNLGERRSNTASVPPDVQRAYAELITNILGPINSEHGAAPPRSVLTFSHDARAVLQDFEDELEPALAPQGKLRHLADWAAKLGGQIARVAALLHLASGYRSDEVISAQTVQSGIAIGRYFLEHELVIFPRGPLQHAQLVLDRLMEQHPISVRDLFERVKGSLHRVSQLHAVLRYLAERGYVRLEATHGRVGRPSEMVYVSPHVNSQNSQNMVANREKENEMPKTLKTTISTETDLSGDPVAANTSAMRSARPRPRPVRLIGTVPEALAAMRWANEYFSKHPSALAACFADAFATLRRRRSA